MINTERLYLRRFLDSDAHDIYEYMSSPEVTKYEPYDPITLKESIQIAKERAISDSFYAICLQTNHKVIGNIYVSKAEPNYVDTYNIGYVLNPSYQGLGYATEAVGTFLGYLFREKKAHRVLAYCNVLNTRSWQLLERLHMRKEATLCKNIYFKLDELGSPIWNDSYMYAILSQEFFLNSKISKTKTIQD